MANLGDFHSSDEPGTNRQHRYLLAEKYFGQIDVFEQRSSVGGAWNYSPGASKTGMSSPVPQLNPHEPAEEPIWINSPEGASEPVFVSPVYDKLETNIPKELMRYSDKAFSAESQLFPKHRTVKAYLEEYAADINNLIHFGTQVKDVRLKDSSMNTWDLTVTNLYTGVETTSTYDAVVVASGHFTVPYLPDIQGIREWDEKYPHSISHSKFYDSPEPFRGLKVVVVGSSASGLDIGAQINEVTKGKLIVSQRSESYLSASASTDTIIRPEIVEFLPPIEYDRGIRFADGHIEKEVDAVVFCTGYLYSYPFLTSLEPPVVTNGWRTMSVYQHLFYIEHPTLVFPGLAQRVIPFPISENQAAVFSRVWSGRLNLPSKDDMIAWQVSEVEQKGNGKAFHILPFPMDADYMNFLYDWASRAEPRPGLMNNGSGKHGTHWGARERWMRSLFPNIRRAFVQKGARRSEIKTLSEIGFDFDAWRLENEQEQNKWV